MMRTLLLGLALGFLTGELYFLFVLHDQRLTFIAALLGIAAMAIRWAITPNTAEECMPGCPKCAESESLGGEEL